jgi:hypothetical protein
VVDWFLHEDQLVAIALGKKLALKQKKKKQNKTKQKS